MRGSSTPCATRSILAFRVSQALYRPSVRYDLAELGRYYRRYHELMAHWRSILPAGAMLDVSYEDVVDNLEEQARRLIDYCGLPWDDRCLSFHETSRPIATASNVQVRRPLYRSSVAAGADTQRTSSRCWPSSRAAAGPTGRQGCLRRLASISSDDCSEPPAASRTKPMTTASQTPGEPADFDVSLPWHCANTCRTARRSCRRLSKDSSLQARHRRRRTTIWAMCCCARASSRKRRSSTSERRSQPPPLPGAQQAGLRLATAGQVRPGRGQLLSSTGHQPAICPRRTTTWRAC